MINLCKSLFILFLLLWSSVGSFGCRSHMEVAKKNIIPLGEDTYTLAYSGVNYSAVKTIVYQTAIQHCEEHGKSFARQSEKRPTQATFTFTRHPLEPTQSVELVFKCLPQNEVEHNK